MEPYILPTNYRPVCFSIQSGVRKHSVKLISKIFLIVIGSAVALFLLAWLSLHVAKYFMYSDYYKQRETVSKIPGLNEGFVPQGLDYDAETDTYIHSGYNGSYVEIYLVKGDATKKLLPVDESGNREKGHAGGVTRAGNYLYVLLFWFFWGEWVLYLLKVNINANLHKFLKHAV